MIPRTTERPSTIALKWQGHYEEGRAVGDSESTLPLPGMLLMLTSGEDGVPSYPAGVLPQTGNGTRVRVRIALEERLGGATPESRKGRNKNTPYAEDDIVPYIEAVPGDVFQVRVPGEANYEIGDLLESTGDGTLEIASGGVALLEVEENFDATDIEDDTVLVRARVI